MKNLKRLLLAAGLLAVPATGSAQEFAPLSIGIGPAVHMRPAYQPGVTVGLARVNPAGDLLAFGPSGHRPFSGPGHSGPRGWRGYGHHGGWSPYDCWDPFWYDPWFGCDGYFVVGYSGFGWWNPYPGWWGFFGFPGWPPVRYHTFRWFGYAPVFWYAPVRYGGWPVWYPGHRGPRYYHMHRHVYHGSGRSGYVTAGGYRSGGHAQPRGRSGDRIVRGSPLFGPRYKEDPRGRVADNGAERSGSRAVPGYSRSGVGSASGRTRPGERPGTRRARPRGDTDTPRTRSTPPKLRTRPGSPPRAKPRSPERSRPTARPTTSRTPSRAKPQSPERSRPTARPATTGRPPQKASAPKRPVSRARPAPRRSGTSKPPPRRGGKG